MRQVWHCGKSINFRKHSFPPATWEFVYSEILFSHLYDQNSSVWFVEVNNVTFTKQGPLCLPQRRKVFHSVLHAHEKNRVPLSL